MLAKNQRLRKQTDIDVVYKAGKKAYHPFFRIIYLKKPDQTKFRYTVIVSKKLSNSAVERNLVKRRIRSAIEKQLPLFKDPCDLIVIAQVKVKTAELTEIEKNLSQVLEKEKVV